MTAMARPALLYFLLWLGVTLSSAMDLEKRIIGGHNCPDAERHFHVKLEPKSFTGKKYKCGGSLIKEQWVLTAAHCWERLGTAKAIVNVHPGAEEEAIDVIKHVPYRDPHRHDIMLLKLKTPPKRIHTVPLPTAKECETDLKIGDKFQVAGLGRSGVDPATLKFTKQSPKKLQCLNDVSVVQCDEKSVKGYKRPRLPYENAFCAQTPGKDTAPGDSGGGVLWKNKLYGTVIGGAGEALVAPFHFLRVCKYLKFIDETTKKH